MRVAFRASSRSMCQQQCSLVRHLRTRFPFVSCVSSTGIFSRKTHLHFLQYEKRVKYRPQKKKKRNWTYFDPVASPSNLHIVSHHRKPFLVAGPARAPRTFFA